MDTSNDTQQPVQGAQPTTLVPPSSTPSQTPQPTPAPPSVFPAAQPSQPNPASAQPSTSGQPSQTQPSQTQPTPQPPSMHARIFDKILSGLSGGPIRVVNPDGSVSAVAQSRSSMAKSIVAAALTGLMTPTHYRETPYGPVVDYSATAADAGARGQAHAQARQQQAQNLSDEQQSRKLMTLQNNSKLLQLQLASSNLQHQRMDQSKSEISDYLKPFQDYNSERNASDPQTPNAFLFQGADHAQALNQVKQFGLTETNLVQDGWKPYIDPQTHAQAYEPTYAAINPALKDIKLSPEVASRLAEMNSQFANIHDIVGGDVRIPVGLYVSALHDYQALDQTEHVLNRLNQTLHPGDTVAPIDLAPIVKGNRNQLVPALYKIQQAVGAGHGPNDGENPANVLDVLLNNAPDLLKPLGLTTQQAADKVDELANKRIAAQKVAAEAGKIAAQKAKPITFGTAPSIANDTNETPERQAQAKAVLAERDQYDAKKEALKAQYAAAKPNPNMMTASMPDGTQVAGTTDELKSAGATGVTKLPAADQSKVGIARQLISPNGLLTNTQKDLAAFKPEELTNVGNRWNEFEAGTLGSGDPRYIALRTDARLLSTALMQAHVGSRGSESIMEHFSNLADAGKMDGDTLKAAIDNERRYVTEKAMLPKAPTTQPQQKQQQTTDPAAAFGGKTRQQ